MARPAAVFTIMLALGAMIFAPLAGARADGREEGPFEIEKCQTISKSGSYKLVKDLTFTLTAPPPGVCLDITTNAVTIDLAGFTISGPGVTLFNNTTAIAAGPDSFGITVRNGSISSFDSGVDLEGNGSIVEGLRVFDIGTGIIATGIVRGNAVVGVSGRRTPGISATGTVTGNYVTSFRIAGILIGQGSTVIGNTSTNNAPAPGFGIEVFCPSNVTDNTAVNNLTNLFLIGDGCNNTNNVAP